MKIVKPEFTIIDTIDGDALLKKIEYVGRVAYQSVNKTTPDSAESFVNARMNQGHDGILEHVSITGRAIVDRGVQNEWVRHRLFSFVVESTRYNVYHSELRVINPFDCEYVKKKLSPEMCEQLTKDWRGAVLKSETSYLKMLEDRATAEMARSVLPLCLATEMVITANLRNWRHFLKLRTAPDAHPQMREIAEIVLDRMKYYIPVVFSDL